MPGWFGPRKFGYGVGPTSWQGWAVTIAVIAALASIKFLNFASLGLPRWTGGVIAIALLIGFVLITAFKKET